MMSSDIVVPGFRFYPTEEELLAFYLQNKLENKREEDMELVIPVVDVYCYDPWHLPAMSGEPCRRDGKEWLFFCPRQEREAHGGRKTRTTPSGHWKATGSPCPVFSNSSNRILGIKRIMVFYQGRAPNGTKTKWKMIEYKCFEDDAPTTSFLTQNSKLRGEYSVCRVYTESGCIRAFDRRPGLDASISETRIIRTPAIQPQMNQEITAPVGTVKRTRSHESISSSNSNGGDESSARFVRQRTHEDHLNDELKLLINDSDNDNWDLLEWFE